MLKTAATHADEGRGLKKSSFGAYISEMSPTGSDGDQQGRDINSHRLMDDRGDDGEIQEGVAEMLAYRMQAKRARPGVKMNKATWESLSPKAQAAWDSLTDEEKLNILRYSAGRSSDGKGDGKPTRKVNFTEVEGGDEEVDDSKPTLEINNTEVEEPKEAHPADPRKMMSTTANKSSKGNQKREVHNARFSFAMGDDDGGIDELVDGYWDDSSDEEDFQ